VVEEKRLEMLETYPYAAAEIKSSLNLINDA